MNNTQRILSILLVMAGTVSGIAQSKENEEKKVDRIQKESSRTDGLKKIHTGHHPDIDINLDETINTAVENALQSVEVTLGKMEINIPPINIDLRGLDELHHINIPEINIPPIDINLGNLNMGMRHFRQDSENDSLKDKTDKTKGLKKLN